jgi:hypothetical protein
MQKFLERKKFFQKIVENFQPLPPTDRKKLKFRSHRRRLPKSFLAAAAEKDIGLHLYMYLCF